MTRATIDFLLLIVFVFVSVFVGYLAGQRDRRRW